MLFEIDYEQKSFLLLESLETRFVTISLKGELEDIKTLECALIGGDKPSSSLKEWIIISVKL